LLFSAEFCREITQADCLLKHLVGYVERRGGSGAAVWDRNFGLWRLAGREYHMLASVCQEGLALFQYVLEYSEVSWPLSACRPYTTGACDAFDGHYSLWILFSSTCFCRLQVSKQAAAVNYETGLCFRIPWHLSVHILFKTRKLPSFDLSLLGHRNLVSSSTWFARRRAAQPSDSKCPDFDLRLCHALFIAVGLRLAGTF
jgi:hypothetical protein